MDAGAAKPLEQALKTGANVQIIGWAYNFGSRSVMCKSPVNAPADLAGKRIRTLPNKIITECLRLMGAAATPMAFGEIYTALQAGVLDGLEHDPPTIAASKFYETAKFYSLTQHNFSALGVFCSGLTLSRMDAPLRDQFLAAAAEAAIDTRARGLEAEKEAIETLKQKGVEIIACDREPFRKLTLPQTDHSSRRIRRRSRSSISSAAPKRDCMNARGELSTNQEFSALERRRVTQSRGTSEPLDHSDDIAPKRARRCCSFWWTPSPRSCWRRT